MKKKDIKIGDEYAIGGTRSFETKRRRRVRVLATGVSRRALSQGYGMHGGRMMNDGVLVVSVDDEGETLPISSLPNPNDRVAYGDEGYEEYRQSGRDSNMDYVVFKPHVVRSAEVEQTWSGWQEQLARIEETRLARTKKLADRDLAARDLAARLAEEFDLDVVDVGYQLRIVLDGDDASPVLTVALPSKSQTGGSAPAVDLHKLLAAAQTRRLSE